MCVFSPKPRHAVKLLSVLKYMAHRTGPDSFFSFPGKNAAVSTSPPPPPLCNTAQNKDSSVFTQKRFLVGVNY